MAKETSSKTEQNPMTPSAAPLFAMTREALAELDKQADRWFEYGGAQMAESLKVGRAMYGQMMSATRAFCEAAEETTNRTMAGLQAVAKPFTGAQA